MQDVTKNRHLYIGGSNISTIMGINKFQTRYDLLLEKCQIVEPEFVSNGYTEYGNIIEPQIRDYYNKLTDSNFIEDRFIEEGEDGHLGIRIHDDGNDSKLKKSMEIKSTSNIHEDVNDYDYYLVQLLIDMYKRNYKDGVLLVYNRPKKDVIFNPKTKQGELVKVSDFNPDNLQTFEIHIDDYEDLIAKMLKAIDKFINDKDLMEQTYNWENRIMEEMEFENNEIQFYINKIVLFQNKIAEMKDIEKQVAGFKAKLKETMIEAVKNGESDGKLVTPNGIKVTLSVPKEDKEVEVEVLDTELYEKENEQLIKEELELKTRIDEVKLNYLIKETQIKKGNNGRLTITMPKKEMEK